MSQKPQSLRALVSPEVFACYCQVEETCIQVEILVLDETFQPGMHFLYDLDTEQIYPVQIDSANTPQYKVSLNYGPSLQHPQNQ